MALIALWNGPKNVRISTDNLWRVFGILTEPVPYTFACVNRRNNEVRAALQCAPALHYYVNLLTQTYTESVLLKYEKIATKYLYSTVHFSYSRQFIDHTCSERLKHFYLGLK